MTASARRSVVADPTRSTAWTDHAACLDEDPELFFPPGNEWKGHEEQEATAKAVCNRCPVVSQCLEKALADGDPYAIRGETNPAERTALKRSRSRQRPIPHATSRGYRAHLKRGERACTACKKAEAMAAAERKLRRAS